MKFEVGKTYKSIRGHISKCLFVSPRGTALFSREDTFHEFSTSDGHYYKEYVEPLKVGDWITWGGGAINQYIIAEVGDSYLLGKFSTSFSNLFLVPKSECRRPM